MGPPQELMSSLATEFHLKEFVETGTYYGGTAVWASKEFERVLTIENSQEIYEITKNKYRDVDNIEFLFGDSRELLDNLVHKLVGPSVFWLDAHWSGGLTYGDDDQCPLIEEIKIIDSSVLDHFIFIDDARLFLSSPQPPHNINQWPTISDLIFALKSNFPNRFIVIIEDVIIAVPEYSKQVVSTYCQNVNAKAWQEYSDSCRKSNTQKGFDLITLDLANKARRIISRAKMMSLVNN